MPGNYVVLKMWNTSQSISVDDRNFPHSVLGVPDASSNVHSTNTLLCANNWATYLQEILLQNVKYVYYPPNCVCVMLSTINGYA